jgi:hypothetical protein
MSKVFSENGNELFFDEQGNLIKEERKQETPEEAAARLYPINNTGSMFIPSRDEVNNSYKQEGFIEGYKLAQERMFSREEVIAIVRKSIATGLTAEYLILALKGGEQ